MIEYLFLILAIPLGLLLAKLTHDEKNIYSKPQYFPTFIWVLAISTAIFLTLNKTVGLTLFFILITTFFWKNSPIKKTKKRR